MSCGAAAARPSWPPTRSTQRAADVEAESAASSGSSSSRPWRSSTARAGAGRTQVLRRPCQCRDRRRARDQRVKRRHEAAPGRHQTEGGLRWSVLGSTRTWPSPSRKCDQLREPDFEAELDELGRGRLPAQVPHRSIASNRWRAFAGFRRSAGLLPPAPRRSPRSQLRPSSISNTGSDPAPIALEQHATKQSSDAGGVQYSEALPQVAGGASGIPSTAGGSAEALKEYSTSLPDSNASDPTLSRATHREIERSAEIGLLADRPTSPRTRPRSSAPSTTLAASFCTRRPRRGEKCRGALRSADPKRQARRCARRLLGDRRGPPRTRQPPTSPSPPSPSTKRLQDSRARLDGLLAQLSTAEAESEREAIGAELRGERRHAAHCARSWRHCTAAPTYSQGLAADRSRRLFDGTQAAAWGIGDACGRCRPHPRHRRRSDGRRPSRTRPAGPARPPRLARPPPLAANPPRAGARRLTDIDHTPAGVNVGCARYGGAMEERQRGPAEAPNLGEPANRDPQPRWCCCGAGGSTQTGHSRCCC